MFRDANAWCQFTCGRCSTSVLLFFVILEVKKVVELLVDFDVDIHRDVNGFNFDLVLGVGCDFVFRFVGDTAGQCEATQCQNQDGKVVVQGGPFEARLNRINQAVLGNVIRLLFITV